MNKVIDTCIGIDQSYKQTALSICRNNHIIGHISITPEDSLCPSEKRKYIINGIHHYVFNGHEEFKINPEKTIVILERIRLFSRGFISFDYMVKTGALVAMIADLFENKGIESYLVDTRRWKKAVVGTCKPEANKYGIAPEKWPTIKYVKSLPEIENKDIMNEYPRQKKGVICKNGKFYTINDDLCDSICISKFFFVGANSNIENLTKMSF